MPKPVGLNSHGAVPIDPMRFRFRLPVIYPINVIHRAIPATVMLVLGGVWMSVIPEYRRLWYRQYDLAFSYVHPVELEKEGLANASSADADEE